MTMHRNALALASICGLLLATSACETTEKKTTGEQAEAQQEIGQAAERTERTVEQAGKEVEQTARQGAGEVRQGAREVGGAAEQMVAGRYERFDAYEDETAAAFAARADAAISRLQKDLQQLRQKAGARMTDDIQDNVGDAQESLREAQTDLQEVRTGTGTIIDDGRLGVAMNINDAQRELSDAYEEIAEPQM